MHSTNNIIINQILEIWRSLIIFIKIENKYYWINKILLFNSSNNRFVRLGCGKFYYWTYQNRYIIFLKRNEINVVMSGKFSNVV